MKLHNTLTGKTEAFTAGPDGTVRLYTCGPTVYAEPHVGNWVAFLRWDLLVRVLRHQGHRLERVMNVTDVGHLTSDADEGEDKMSAGARRENKSEWEVAERYTNRFLEGMTALNLMPPEHLLRATDHIDAQIGLIERLEKAGYTYVLDDGVYFDTGKFPTYADFARLDLSAQKAGARVKTNEGKRHASDFVLWRLTPKGESRNMEWDSPWGKGIPGWHIECSAMALEYLGETIDIHTGGIDHIPVHHTNEIAQVEAVTGKPFARFWLHASFLLVGGTKVSKSLGNGYTLDDLESHGFGPMDFRMFILQSHYRTESNFTWENMSAAKNRLERWKMVAVLRHQADEHASEAADARAEEEMKNGVNALADDLNSPLALTHFDNALDHFESAHLSPAVAAQLEAALVLLDDLLGLRLMASTPDIDAEDARLMAQRQAARAEQDWERSDELRDRLAQHGIAVNDTATGSVWYRMSA